MKPLTHLKQNLNIYLWAIILFGLAAFWLFGGIDYLKYTPTGQITASRMADFVTLTMSVILGALPFVILGVLISVLVGLFVNEQFLLKYLPRNRFLSHVTISLLGMLMPVCECGNIPVGRRLLLKGFSVSQTFSFLLAAPVINVVTIWATAEAFGYEPVIVVARILGAFIIANFVGILLSYQPNQNEFLTESFMLEMRMRQLPVKNKFHAALDIFQKEFIAVMKMLILGAFIVATIRTFLPQSLIEGIGSNPIMSVIAMMILAFILSVCSSIDAFLALSLATTFTSGAIVAFLIFGPMIDIKILSMLKASFKPKLLLTVSILVAMISLVIGLLVNLIT
jgi:uncharacterized membrane protein YraQ (UPF0718 family)